MRRLLGYVLPDFITHRPAVKHPGEITTRRQVTKLSNLLAVHAQDEEKKEIMQMRKALPDPSGWWPAEPHVWRSKNFGFINHRGSTRRRSFIDWASPTGGMRKHCALGLAQFRQDKSPASTAGPAALSAVISYGDTSQDVRKNALIGNTLTASTLQPARTGQVVGFKFLNWISWGRFKPRFARLGSPRQFICALGRRLGRQEFWCQRSWQFWPREYSFSPGRSVLAKRSR